MSTYFRVRATGGGDGAAPTAAWRLQPGVHWLEPIKWPPGPPPGLPTIFPGIPPQLIGIFPWPILDSLVAVGPLMACNLSPVMWINHVASGHIHDEYLMRPDDIPAYRKRTLLRKLRATFPAHQFSAIRISCWIKALELRSIIPVHYLSAQHRARTRFKHMQTRCNYAKLQICIHVALSVNTSFA